MVKCRSRISKNGFLPCVCLVEALHPLDTHRLQSLTFQPKFNGNSFRSFLLGKINLWNTWHLLSFWLFELCARHFLSFTSLVKNTMQQSLKTTKYVNLENLLISFYQSNIRFWICAGNLLAHSVVPLKGCHKHPLLGIDQQLMKILHNRK